jgi:glutamate racemase
MQTDPIGIFDSGLGGLTVLRVLRELLPHENCIYFGDTAHLPYGNKSPETILRYSLESAHFLIQQQIKLLVIACHSACSAALESIRKDLDIPVIGIVEQGIDEITRRYSDGTIALLATRATVHSGLYERLLEQRNPALKLFSLACPLFVPLVEEGYEAHPISTQIIREHLQLLKPKAPKAALLGCTHFPLLRPLIQQELGPDIPLIDPASACAAQTKTTLIAHDLLNPQTSPGTTQFFVSSDPEKFRLHSKTFLGHPIEHVNEA